ncbi:MAG: MotA/TolQ/ExbB proton channel family protein [Verrucomicrobia bacterium]|nr:MAG: MotA/TolQ/ExbB proton channel family protein [Verrucomicrobiota bacterium]
MKSYSRHPFMQIIRLLTLLGALLIACPLPTAHAQAPAAAAGEVAAPKPAAKKTNLWETIALGGTVMIFIGIMSVFTIYLVVDIYARTSKKKLAPPMEVEKARALFMAGDYVNCYQVMKNTPSAFTNCVRYALSFVGKGKDQTEEALLVEVGRENNRLQNRINYLSVIGVCAPMVGLVGTVIGMMSAFAALGETGASDTSKLSEAIGHVLVATAAGLFIAIPAFAFFYILRNHLTAQMHWLEDEVMSLFRNMPYDHFQGLEIGEELTYAAIPNWVQEGKVPEPAAAS